MLVYPRWPLPRQFSKWCYSKPMPTVPVEITKFGWLHFRTVIVPAKKKIPKQMNSDFNKFILNSRILKSYIYIYIYILKYV
jgi:hypothetical protein